MLKAFYNSASGNGSASESSVTVETQAENKRNLSDTSILDNSLENSAKQGRVDSSSPILSEENSLLKHIESMFVSLHDKLDNEMNSVRSRIDMLHEKFTSFEEHAATRQAEICELQSRVSSLERENEQLGRRVSDFESAVSECVSSEPSWQPTGSGETKVILIGDSNSAGKLKFGTGKGTLGAALPGTHAFSPTVDDIPRPSAEIYSGCSDIIVAVGTNNLKEENCNPETLVRKTFDHVKNLSKSNPSAHIFLPGVLPTCSTSVSINDKILKYNYYLKDMCNSIARVSFIDTKNFSDSSGKLQARFACGELDPLHLNEAGRRFYFSRLKYALRSRHNLPLPRRPRTENAPEVQGVVGVRGARGQGRGRGSSVRSRGGRSNP